MLLKIKLKDMAVRIEKFDGKDFGFRNYVHKEDYMYQKNLYQPPSDTKSKAMFEANQKVQARIRDGPIDIGKEYCLQHQGCYDDYKFD